MFSGVEYNSRLELKILRQLGGYQAAVIEWRKDHFTTGVAFSTSSVGCGCVDFHLALRVASAMEARGGTVP